MSDLLTRPSVSDFLSLALAVLLGVETTLAIVTRDPWLAFAAVLAGVALGVRLGSWVVLHREQAAARAVLEQLPQSVTFTRDEDGQVTALVQRGSGEPYLVTVPPDVAEEGPVAAAAWVLANALGEQ